MNKIIKVCFVAPIPSICRGINIPTVRSGGIATWMLQIWKYILSGNTNVQMCYVDISTKKRTVEGSNLWDRIVVSGFSMLSIKKEFKNVIKMYSPDVIHLTTSGSLGIIRDIVILNYAKKINIPVVYHLHFGRIPEIVKRKNQEYKLMLIALKMSSKVIVIDKQTCCTLKQYIDNNKIYYVPNFIDATELPTISVKNKKEIVFLGWIVKNKGIEELLAAWQILFEQNPGWVLRIVGPYSNGYFNYLNSRFSTRGVIFDGEKSHAEAMKIVNESEIFILPSYNEGFPYSILEAMTLRKAIIATNVGAISEMLTDDCGLLINPQSINDIVKALTRLMKDSKLRSQLGDNAFVKAMDQYIVNKVFKQYEYIWEKSIETRA